MIRIEDDVKAQKLINTNKGIIFCQVVSKRHIGHLMAFIAEGNQK